MNTETIYAELHELAELSLLITKRCVELQNQIKQIEEAEEYPFPDDVFVAEEIPAQTFSELASWMIH